MPLPVIHSFAGYSLYRATRKKKRHWFLLLFCILFANLADFDFIPGLITGSAYTFHRHCSHSLLFAVAVAAVIALAYAGIHQMRQVLKRETRQDVHPAACPMSRIFIIVFSTYGSHILLDFFSGPGVPLLWPLTDHFFNFPIEIFQVARQGVSMHDVTSLSEFAANFLSPVWIRPMLFEASICFMIWAICSAVKDIRAQSTLRGSMALSRAVQACIFALGFMMI